MNDISLSGSYFFTKDNFMFEEILTKIDDVVWGIPTIALILITGIVLTIRLRGVQFSKLGRGFKTLFKK